MLTCFPINCAAFYIGILDLCSVCIPNKAARPSILISSLITCNCCSRNADILNARIADLAKGCSVYASRNRKVLQLKEIAVELPRKRCSVVTDRCQSSAAEIDVILEHVILCNICAHRLKFRCITDELIIVVCCRRRSTIHCIARRRHSSSIPNMCCTVICCIGVHHNRAADICRVEETNALAHDLDVRRGDRAHINNISEACNRRIDRRRPACSKRSIIDRTQILC